MTGKTNITGQLETATCGSAANHSGMTREEPTVASDTAVMQDNHLPTVERTPRRMGRSRRYKTPEAMEPIINRYLLRASRPTMTGLALELGFTSRQALLNYKRYGEEFRHTVLTARLRMECHYEKMLLAPGCSTRVAILALKRLGWRG